MRLSSMADNNTNNPNNTNGHLTAEDYGLTTPSAADTPVPAFGGNDGGNDYGISLPIAPEGGIPAYPGDSNNDYGISLPIAPEGGIPAYPGNTVCTPPVCTLPVFPSCPSCGISQNNAQVRFLNASSNTFPVNISIDNTNYATNSRFGTISNYGQISDGFHTVTVRRASGLRAVLLQQTFPFSAGQRYTMVLVDTAAGGLNMIQVPSTGCNNMNYNTGCYRVANMSYSGSSFDIRMYNGDTVFRNVGFTQVTSYKRALAGNYTFYLSNTNFQNGIRELPIIIIGALTGTSPVSSPLASGNVTIQTGQNTTTYIVGNTWSAYSLQMITVND